jgi:methylmalonyl-CoA mutase N-terminal domain/subunit
VDPLGGSYLIETLTDEIQAQAEAYVQKIDDLGGSVPAIERGYIQGEIQDAAYQHQLAIESGEEVVVGVNAFKVESEVDLDPLKVNPVIEQEQKEALKRIRENRDPSKAAELLGLLEAAARGGENMVPLFITCVENEITLGEICGVLRDVWGEFRSVI